MSTTTEPQPITEQAFRDFIEAWPEIGYLKNERLEHVFANRRAIEAMRLDPDRFIGSTSRDLFPPEAAERFEAADRKILDGAPFADVPDTRADLADGIRWIHDVKIPVVTADGRRLVGGLGIDVTERVRAEEGGSEHRAFEHLISDIAARLNQARPGDMPGLTAWTLRSLGELLRVERVFTVQFDGPHLFMADIWQSERWADAAGHLDGDIAQACPWVADHLRAGRPLLSGPGLRDLPEAAAPLRRMLEAAGVTSGVVLPMRTDTGCLGGLGVDAVLELRSYSDEIIQRLQIVADMLAATQRRIAAETELCTSLEEVNRLRERLEQENRHLRREATVAFRPDGIVGESPGLKRVLAQVEQVAPTGSSVLITGETGVGKELVAIAIHRASDRADRTMIKVNCAALPPTLIEGELFGREKGAFTGATTRQPGRFEVADGSTIFLDEIGDLPPELQAKLLHVLQDGELTRLGSNKPIRVDVRVVAATNRDLAAAVREKRFREDLFYRLNVFPIEVPPLRERCEDVIPLAWSFIDEFARKMGKTIGRIDHGSADAMTRYDWPGNVRELRNVIERAMILAPGDELSVDLGVASGGTSDTEVTIDAVQRRHIIEVLRRVDWQVGGKGGAAELLGLPRSTLRARMKKLGIAPRAG